MDKKQILTVHPAAFHRPKVTFNHHCDYYDGTTASIAIGLSGNERYNGCDIQVNGWGDGFLSQRDNAMKLAKEIEKRYNGYEALEAENIMLRERYKRVQAALGELMAPL